ncbi:MAG: asparagine synthase (glutamine-hydrolyzing) [Planctomycetota bacterium]|nr:asparagine synthase (glutamine-hydrolyzing) [Planctomycetota bacterium]
MCGIFGVVLRDPAGQIDLASVLAARDTLIHRGPDEAGIWSRPGVAFAHRRLKVLDLTHGQQPAVSPDERFALVYNGEVYNFQELRKRYAAEGADFTTRCDTEVVFHGLNAHGPDAVTDFHGMFAFGHWDDRQRKLLLVRDRLGKKPLYWHADDRQIVFASELKAVLAYLGRRFDIDPVALDCYFGRGYIPAPRTIFQGISKLRAGTMLRLDAGPGKWQFDVRSYWDFQPRATPAKPEEALDELDALLTDAVRSRLVSDVPIGCLLSGGIDSSLVTALAAKVSAEPVRAFSIGFDESEAHNELPFAEMVARRHKCLWQSRPVRGDDFPAMLDDVVPFLDEPYGNFTVFSMRRLAQLAREDLVVVLSGQGGDELAAGYPGRYNWILQTPAGPASTYAPPVDDLVQHLNHSSFVPWRGAREVILSPGFKDAIAHAAGPADDLLPFWDRHHPRGRLNNLLYTDLKTNLADYLILLEERMTMSASLEARNPLLDDRVVDFMLSLPNEMKVRDGKNKWILMELARRYVPAEAIDRPKRGFTPPLEKWVAGSAALLAKQFRETDGQTGSLYSQGWRDFLRAGKYNAGALMPVYYSLMLSRWAKQFEAYIGVWPGEAARGGEAAAKVGETPASARGPWQDALRAQDPLALAESRWFCQAMGNFPAGARVRLRGDDAGWFAFLARGCGLAPVESESAADAAGAASPDLVCVGLDAALNLLAGEGAKVAAGSPTILIVAPFAGAQADRAKALLEGLGKAFLIKGYQAPSLAPDRAVLIVRCQPAARPATVA